jgi:hypothetical protein
VPLQETPSPASIFHKQNRKKRGFRRVSAPGVTHLALTVSAIGRMHQAECTANTHGIVLFKEVAITVSAASLVMLAIALAPNVPTALATIGKDDATMSPPAAEHSCASFEVWFLDPACSLLQHAKKVALTKQRRAHKASK